LLEESNQIERAEKTDMELSLRIVLGLSLFTSNNTLRVLVQDLIHIGKEKAVSSFKK